MADLDDFFAKKDKKKSKVKKFTASELLNSPKYQQGEDVAAVPTGVPKKQPVEKPKKEEVVQESVDSEIVAKSKPTAEAEEEEWGEFEQEKERDYSGLKIQKLQIQDSEDDYGEDSGEQELNEEGEPIKKEPTGPWNKIGAQPTPNVKVKEVAPAEIPTPNTAGGVYIPPSKRNQPAGGASQGSSSTRSRTGKKEKGAPDLASEEYFPTLSAAVAIEQNNFKLKKFEQTERGFTEAKPSRSHSNRTAVGPGEDGPRLHLGNKFNALSNDDS